MRVPLGVSFGLIALVTLTVPAQAEYLLNCRLMDPGSPDYKRYCMGELSKLDLIKRCNSQGVCIVRAQNFKSAYAANKSPTGGLVSNVSSSGSLAGGALSGVSNSATGAATAAGGLIGGAGSTVGSVLGRATP
jgi:hypothetical protein